MKKSYYVMVTRISKSLLPNQVYQTTSYAILKVIVGNRGKHNGIEEKRVLFYVDLIKRNMFFDDISIIIVNYAGKIIDGANRVEACKRCGIPVLFKMTIDPRLNVKNEDILLDNIAILNASNPTWKPKQQIDSAEISGSPLALALKDIRAILVADRTLGITEKDLTTNQMFTFLSKSKKALHGMKRNRVEFKNAELARIANSNEFFHELRYICTIIRYFKIGSIRPSKVLERLMPLIWNQTIDKDVFYSNLVHKGFRFKKYEPVTCVTIQQKILKLSGVKISK